MDVIIGGSAGNSNFELIEVPAATPIDSTNSLFAGCRVASNGSRAAVADTAGTVVKFYAINSPVDAVLLGSADVSGEGIAAISSIAVDGERVLLGASTNGRVALVDFTVPGSPAIVSTVTSLLGAVTSIGFQGTTGVASDTTQGNIAMILVGASSLTPSTFSPGLGASILMDLDGNHLAVVGINTRNVRWYTVSGSTPTLQGLVTVLGTFTVGSVAVASGSWIVLGATNGNQAGFVDIATSAQSTFTTSSLQGVHVAVSPTHVYAAGRLAATLQVFNIVGGTPTSAGAPTATGFVYSRIHFATFATVPGLTHDAPAGLNFGTACVGGAPVDLSLTISSTGTQALVVNAFTPPAGYAVLSPPALPVTIPVGNSVVFTVRFSPSVAGPANGSLGITSNAAPVSIPVTGMGEQDVITPNPASLAFGAWHAGHWTALALTITNGNPTENLTLAQVSTSSTEYRVSTSLPAALPPDTTLINPFAPIAPAASVTLYVVFAPTSSISFPGTLTIQGGCNPVTVPLSGTGIIPSVGAVLVLDRSGSMAGLAAGGVVTKMEALKTATQLFIDLIPEGANYRLGTVEFDTTATDLTTLTVVNPAAKTAAGNAVALLTPRFLTSIGGGMEKARLQLAGTPVGHRKVMVVFTDGMENRTPMIATEQPLAVAAGIQVYAVGLGTASTLDSAKLATLASATSGTYFETDDPLQLQKDYLQILADTYGLAIAADPIHQVAAGQTATHAVESTEFDRRLTFVCAWEDASRPLEFEVVAPDGSILTPGSFRPDVTYLRRGTYAIYRVRVGRIGRRALGPFAKGTWKMRVQAPARAGQRYITSFLVDSDVTFGAFVPPAFIGGALQFDVQLHDLGKPMPKARVEVSILAPALSASASIIRSLGARKPGPGPLDASVTLTLPPGTTPKVRRLPNLRANFVAGGVYRARLAKTFLDGVYRVTINVSLKTKQGIVTRYRSFSVVPIQRVDTIKSTIETRVRPDGLISVRVTPRDGGGNLLGVGRALELKPAPGAGVRVMDVVDRVDGSYELSVAATAGAGRRLSLSMAGGRLDVKLPAVKGPKQR